MSAATLGLAFLAGLLSALSPCVLPLLPLVLGAAAAEHKWAPALLALGVAISFVVIGLFVATLGFSIGLDGDTFRLVAAALMAALGVILLFPGLQARVAAAGGPISDKLSAAFGAGPASAGLYGQFGVGLLLGAVWSPCVGPTLGAASVLASRGRGSRRGRGDNGRFRDRRGACPCSSSASCRDKAFARWRESLLSAGKRLKQATGARLFSRSACSSSAAPTSPLKPRWSPPRRNG